MALQMIKRSINNPSFHGPGTVMRMSLIISFFFHGVAILTFQEVFPFHWAVDELPTYRVELIRPPIEDISPYEIPEPEIERIKQRARPTPEPEQDTISLDTKDKRYATYAKAIKERIKLHWKYPPEAMEILMEGRLTVLFSLAREGNLTQTKTIRISGHEILDKEAIRAIRAAAPFPPFPEHITVRRLNIKANFDYRLTSRK